MPMMEHNLFFDTILFPAMRPREHTDMIRVIAVHGHGRFTIISSPTGRRNYPFFRGVEGLAFCLVISATPPSQRIFQLLGIIGLVRLTMFIPRLWMERNTFQKV